VADYGFCVIVMASLEPLRPFRASEVARGLRFSCAALLLAAAVLLLEPEPLAPSLRPM